MVTNTRKNHLPIFLPVVRGRYSFEVNLSTLTWFQVGGAAFVLYKPEDVFDLQSFLKEKSAELQYFVLGAGSNVLCVMVVTAELL